jgi:hypothetical protein
VFEVRGHSNHTRLDAIILYQATWALNRKTRDNNLEQGERRKERESDTGK